MKKLLIVLLALVILCPSAYAIICSPQGPGESEQCWTQVKIKEGYTTLVSRGHVLVASKEGITVANNDGWTARHSRESTGGIVLGVAQTSIVTGDANLILVRGRGVVRYVEGTSDGGIVSGDSLAINSAASLVSRAGTVIEYSANKGDQTSIVGQSLETNTADDADNWAYIKIY